MAPPLSSEHLSILNKEFYENLNFFGRDKLFNLLRDKYGEDKSPSRRQIADWLKQQEINQIYTPSKGKGKTIKSSMTTPNKILGMDLVNMEKFQVKGYKYLLNAIDISRFLYSVALKNKTDKEVLEGFKKIYNTSKIKAIISDNGSEFINKKFKDYLEKNGIEQILGEAGKPQSNGMIERANGSIKELIQKSIPRNE